MDELEARVRCLELAATINRASGEHFADAIVKTATVLYTFIQTPLPEETPVINADKQKQKKVVGKALDILS